MDNRLHYSVSSVARTLRPPRCDEPWNRKIRLANWSETADAENHRAAVVWASAVAPKWPSMRTRWIVPPSKPRRAHRRQNWVMSHQLLCVKHLLADLISQETSCTTHVKYLLHFLQYSYFWCFVQRLPCRLSPNRYLPARQKSDRLLDIGADLSTSSSI